MRSHILFTSECQVKTIEERVKRLTNESYWVIKDHTDFTYLAYAKQKKVVDALVKLLPTQKNILTPPMKLTGYVSQANGGRYLVVLHVAVWNPDLQNYSDSEGDSEGDSVCDSESDSVCDSVCDSACDSESDSE